MGVVRYSSPLGVGCARSTPVENFYNNEQINLFPWSITVDLTHSDDYHYCIEVKTIVVKLMIFTIVTLRQL